jgi:tetratricopeptide (TPR) repeat protein
VEHALALDPGLGEAWFCKGYILYGTDTTGADALCFQRAIEHGFEEAYAYYFRGLTHLREHNEDLALRDFDQALLLSEDFALAYHERAGVKRMLGDLQGAHFDYRTAIQYQPEFPQAYNNLGSVKILLGDYEGALADYTTAITMDPGLFLAYNNRGYAHYFMGDPDAALEDFNAALLLKEDFPEASLNKSSLLAGQDRMQEALSLLDTAIVNDPESAILYLNRGLVRELTGDLKGACEDWARAGELGAASAQEYLSECND